MSEPASKTEIERQIARLREQLDGTAVAFPIMKRDARGNERPIGCAENTEALLLHYGVSCRYNEMSKMVELAGLSGLHPDKVLNDSITIVRDCARIQGYDPSVAEENLGPISGRNSYHPVRDWITSVKWDGTDRIGDVLTTVVTSEDDDYKRMLLTKWMISAVALIMYDTPHENADHRAGGFKGVEGILVFKGKQGLGKTQWIESLTPAKSGWAKDAVTLDPHNKDSVLLATSHWIVELGEIDATFKKTDIAALKGFATQKIDIIRPAYAKVAERYARRTAFTGTVNDEKFLAETGEHRRWWVLGVESINARHGLDMQQVWAQVYDMYMQCTPFWLLPEERERVYANNATYERIDPLIESLEQFVSRPLSTVGAASGKTYESLGAVELGEWILTRRPTKPEANTIANWLKQQGFRQDKATKKFHIKRDKEGFSLFEVDAGRQYGFSKTKG